MKKSKSKGVFSAVFILLISSLLIAVIPTEAEGALYEDTLRLHILANSDSENDQKLKLHLRDAILKEYSNELFDAENKEAAVSRIEKMLPEIKSFAKKEIEAQGYNYGVDIKIGTEWYDTRNYDDFTLPKGYYTSLKIIIGDGEGKNWWCVMFPPLCLDIACENAPNDDAITKYTDEEIHIISNKGYNPKFKILEIISDLFSD